MMSSELLVVRFVASSLPPPGGVDCRGFDFLVGKKYLVFANARDTATLSPGTYGVNWCGGTVSLESGEGAARLRETVRLAQGNGERGSSFRAQARGGIDARPAPYGNDGIGEREEDRVRAVPEREQQHRNEGRPRAAGQRPGCRPQLARDHRSQCSSRKRNTSSAHTGDPK